MTNKDKISDIDDFQTQIHITRLMILMTANLQTCTLKLWIM